ncbi:MAG: iron-sulfur cluster assembly scaffold protein [Clostridiales bacterium]|nr:iron-sulfur cluster assembly scaffold protein [Clostridiales bacterium]MCF8021789.1 iron-sulfur cluster assembly scaffold protein [Clostridiales bacterium]
MDYNDSLKDHFENPRNVGVVKNYNGYGKIGDPGCGDVCEITIHIENNVIDDIMFKAYGCPGAIATSSAVTEIAKGKDIDSVLKLKDDDVINYLGNIPEEKKHCSLLGIKALHAAVDDYLNNNLKSKKQV